MGDIVKLWGASRLERLKDGVLNAVSNVHKNPCTEGRNSTWLPIGKVVYEAAMRDFKPAEIPKALRPCPWFFVIAELSRAYPEIKWHEESLVTLVECYIESLQKVSLEQTLFTPSRSEGA
jgi:hypothetical protein